MSTTKRPLLRTTVVACIAAAGIVLSTAPAQAAYTDCPAGYACLWTTKDYPGTPNGRFYTNMKVTIGINAIVNNGNSLVAAFYDRGDYTGTHIKLNNPARKGQTRDPYLKNGTDATSESWLNRISSAKFVS